jgi:phosphatidate cytidylyltransferase
MLKQRVITAIILLIVLVGSIYLSPLAFAAGMTFAVAAAIWEWLRMLGVKAALPVAAVMGIVLYALWVMGFRLRPQALLALTAADAAIWFLLTVGLFRDRNTGFRLPVAAQGAMAVLMLPLAWYSILWLFEIGSWQMVISVLAIVWSADICAYFCGRFFGGKIFGDMKMAPAISPKKTWEGALGAYILGLCVLFAIGIACAGRADVFQSVLITETGFLTAVVVTLLLTLFSMAGDLLESAAKRQAGIKDSSNLLPGHGGWFDRLDSCVPVMPAVVLIILLTTIS